MNTQLSLSTGLDEPGPGNLIFHCRLSESLHRLGIGASSQ